jgi:hypothetical protein
VEDRTSLACENHGAFTLLRAPGYRAYLLSIPRGKRGHPLFLLDKDHVHPPDRQPTLWSQLLEDGRSVMTEDLTSTFDSTLLETTRVLISLALVESLY